MDTPASSNSWICQSFGDGVTLNFHAKFNHEQLAKLQAGLRPLAMEDKWFVFYDEPYLMFHRSWTGEPVFRLEFAETSEGVHVVEALWSKHLASKPNADVEYQAHLLEFLLYNLLLHESRPFPLPKGMTEPFKGVFQHHIAGTCYPEIKTDKKPWWRLW